MDNEPKNKLTRDENHWKEKRTDWQGDHNIKYKKSKRTGGDEKAHQAKEQQQAIKQHLSDCAKIAEEKITPILQNFAQRHNLELDSLLDDNVMRSLTRCVIAQRDLKLREEGYRSRAGIVGSNTMALEWQHYRGPSVRHDGEIRERVLTKVADKTLDAMCRKFKQATGKRLFDVNGETVAASEGALRSWEKDYLARTLWEAFDLINHELPIPADLPRVHPPRFSRR